MVLSGALSKTGYQIGFIKSLLKYIDREEIKVITGSSMGMLCGYALAADKMETFEVFFRNIDVKNRHRLLYNVLFKNLVSREMREFVNNKDHVSIPLAFPVCYIPICNVQYYWLSGEYDPIWFRYMIAAINNPILHIFPSFLNKRFAIDGGAADNIPLFPLLAHGRSYLPSEDNFDLIVVMHFDARYDYRSEFSTDIPILELDLSICNDFNKNHYDFSSRFVDEMIVSAERYGDRIFGQLFAGDFSKEYFQKTIDEIFMAEHALRQKNMSADRLVTLLNHIGKYLRKDSDCNKELY